MAAQLHLAAGGKPARFIIGASRHQESGLRKIIFCCDLAQQLVI